MQKTKLPRGNRLMRRGSVNSESCGLLKVTFGTKYDRYEYHGNMGNTYERDIAPLLEYLLPEEDRRMMEALGEYYCDGRNVYDSPSYSWIRILKHSPAEQANREDEYKRQRDAADELERRREEILSRLTEEERRIIGV